MKLSVWLAEAIHEKQRPSNVESSAPKGLSFFYAHPHTFSLSVSSPPRIYSSLSSLQQRLKVIIIIVIRDVSGEKFPLLPGWPAVWLIDISLPLGCINASLCTAAQDGRLM